MTARCGRRRWRRRSGDLFFLPRLRGGLGWPPQTRCRGSAPPRPSRSRGGGRERCGGRIAHADEIAEEKSHARVPCHGLGVLPANQTRDRERTQAGGPLIVGKTCDRQSACKRFEQHEAERIGAAWKHKDIGARIDGGEFCATLGPEEERVR